MIHALVGYGLGLGTVALAKAYGPRIAAAARPIIRDAIRQGIVVNREVQRAVEEARSELEDIAAEAREELEKSTEPVTNGRS